VKFPGRYIKLGVRIKDRVELDAVGQAVARSKSILQWNRLRAKTLPVIGYWFSFEFKLWFAVVLKGPDCFLLTITPRSVLLVFERFLVMGNSTLHHPTAYFDKLFRRLLAIPAGGPEISDVIVDFDPDTLARRPVYKQSVINDFFSQPSTTAAAIVERIPSDDNGMLDPEAVDRLLVTVHCEMQRLSEELQHGRRVAQLLNPILQAVPHSDSADIRRVVDVGCGSGYVIRWLAAHKAVPDNVELIGADYHSALIKEAHRLAELENLRCQFVVANAFTLKQPATVYLSTGILHHFRGPGLVDLFKLHQGGETKAFLHFDFHPSALAPFGSWLFHIVRMRAALARYDGVLSAVRAYRAEELLAAARSGAPDFVSTIYGTRLWGLPIPRAFHCLVGIRPKYRDAFIAQMKGKLASLGVLE